MSDNEKIEQFERELNLLDEQVKLSINELKTDIEKNKSNDVNLHLKYADVESLIEVLREQINWQRDHLKEYVKDDTRDEQRLSAKIDEMAETMNTLSNALIFQKDRMKSLTDNLDTFGKAIANLRNSKMIASTIKLNDMDKARKNQGDRIAKLEKKLEKKHDILKSRIKKIQDNLED